jgi:hypothetical protein
LNLLVPLKKLDDDETLDCFFLKSSDFRSTKEDEGEIGNQV